MYFLQLKKMAEASTQRFSPFPVYGAGAQRPDKGIIDGVIIIIYKTLWHSLQSIFLYALENRRPSYAAFHSYICFLRPCYRTLYPLAVLYVTVKRMCSLCIILQPGPDCTRIYIKVII